MPIVNVMQEHELQNAYIWEYQEWWQPWANTLAYFPFSTDFNDVMGNKTLTVSWPTISWWYAEITWTYQYMKLNSGIWGTDITVSLRYYYNGNSPFNTLICRDGWGRHHLLFPWTISGFGTTWTLWFYNDYNAQWWYPSTWIATLNTRNYITIVKSWTNEKIYLNGVLVLDSNDSFDNASNPIEIIGNSGTSWNQWSIWLLSEVIFESVLWSAQEVADYYNQTKANYGL